MGFGKQEKMVAMLRLKDIVFEVDHRRSSFSAYVPQQPQDPPERLCWSLDIQCVEKEYDRGFWTPLLYAQNIAFDVRTWQQITGKSLTDEGDDGLQAFLYVQEHERTSSNLLHFLSRQGNLFTVEWSCLAAAYWDDKYSSHLPLQLKTVVEFDGVHLSWVKADRKGLATAKTMVAKYLDLACLQEPEVVGPSHIVFRPRSLV